MKIASLICLLLAITCQATDYWASYVQGRLEGSASYLLAILFWFGALLISLTLLLSALIRQKNRIWTAAMFLGLVASLLLQIFALPPPACMYAYGLRDRIMSQFTIDDLRAFAQQWHREMPGFNLREGQVADLKGQQDEIFVKLEKKFPFLGWGVSGKGNPYVWDEDNREIDVAWGGPFGHWGFCISTNGQRLNREPIPHEFMWVLHVSDDIYFFSGE